MSGVKRVFEDEKADPDKPPQKRCKTSIRNSAFSEHSNSNSEDVVTTTGDNVQHEEEDDDILSVNMQPNAKKSENTFSTIFNDKPLDIDYVVIEIYNEKDTFELSSLIPKLSYFEAKLADRWNKNKNNTRNNSNNKQQHVPKIEICKSPNSFGFTMKDFKTLLKIGESGMSGRNYPCTKEFLQPLLCCNEFFAREIINEYMLIDYLSNHKPGITFKQRQEWLLSTENPFLKSVLTTMNEKCLNTNKKSFVEAKNSGSSALVPLSDETLMNQLTSGLDFKFDFSKDGRHVLSVELVFPGGDVWFQIKRRKLHLKRENWNAICECLIAFCKRFDNIDREIYSKHQDSSTYNNIKFICNNGGDLHRVGFDIAKMIHKEIIGIEAADYMDSGDLKNTDDENKQNDIDDEAILAQKQSLFEKLIIICFDWMSKCGKKYKNAYHWYEKVIPFLPIDKVRYIFARMIKNDMIDGSCSYPDCYDCKWMLFLLFIQNGEMECTAYGARGASKYDNDKDAELKPLVKETQFIQCWLYDMLLDNNNKKQHKKCVDWWFKYLKHFDKHEITSIFGRLLNRGKESNIGFSFDVLTFFIQHGNIATSDTVSNAASAVSKLLLKLVTDSGNDSYNYEQGWKWIKMCLDKGCLGKDEAAVIFAELGTNDYTNKHPIKTIPALIQLDTMLFEYCDFKFFEQMKKAIQEFLFSLMKWNNMADHIKAKRKRTIEAMSSDMMDNMEQVYNKHNIRHGGTGAHNNNGGYPHYLSSNRFSTLERRVYNLEREQRRLLNNANCNQKRMLNSSVVFPIDINQVKKSLEICENVLFEKSTPQQLEYIFLHMFGEYSTFANFRAFGVKDSAVKQYGDRVMRYLCYCCKDCDLSQELTQVMHYFIRTKDSFIFMSRDCKNAAQFGEWLCNMMEKVLNPSEVSKLALHLLKKEHWITKDIDANYAFACNNTSSGSSFKEKFIECVLDNCDISLILCDTDDVFVEKLIRFVLKRKDAKFQVSFLNGLERATKSLSTKDIEKIAQSINKVILSINLMEEDVVVNQKLVEWVNDAIGTEFVSGAGIAAQESTWPPET